MMYDETLWAEIIDPMLPRFNEEWAVRQALSQVWNKKSRFNLDNTCEYVDENKLVACKELFREAVAELAKRPSISQLSQLRNVILQDVHL